MRRKFFFDIFEEHIEEIGILNDEINGTKLSSRLQYQDTFISALLSGRKIIDNGILCKKLLDASDPAKTQEDRIYSY